MKGLAKNPQRMPYSGIREIMDLSARLPDVIHLECGEPDFPTPPHIIEAAFQAAKEGYTKYTPNAGILSLREAIAEKVRNYNKIKVSAENVVVTTGSMFGLASALMCIVEPGEEVLVPDPGWPNYEMMALGLGANPRRYHLYREEGFLPSLDDLKKRVREKTKALVINTPSNPTGAVFPKSQLRDLIRFIHEYDLYLISDEVYDQIIFEGEHISPAQFDAEGRVVSVFSFSKTYAMTGWRIGYVVASEEIIQTIAKLQEPYVACASAISQKAAEAALRGPQDCVKEMVNSYLRRRNLAVEILEPDNLLAFRPHGAFYILIDISKSQLNSRQFSQLLLENQKVAVAPGSAFGEMAKDHIRVSLAAEERDLMEGLKRILDFLKQRG